MPSASRWSSTCRSAWTAYVPSLSGVTFADEAFAYGPYRATGPATITGALTGGAPDCTGYTNGAIAWQDDASIASPAILPVDAPEIGPGFGRVTRRLL